MTLKKIMATVKTKPPPPTSDNEESECDTEDEIERYIQLYLHIQYYVQYMCMYHPGQNYNNMIILLLVVKNLHH